MATLAEAPAPVKVSKLADIYDNLRDSRGLSAGHRARTIQRSMTYLEALEKDLPEIARTPMALVRQLLEDLPRIGCVSVS